MPDMQHHDDLVPFVNLVDHPIHIGLSPVQKLAEAIVFGDDEASPILRVFGPGQSRDRL